MTKSSKQKNQNQNQNTNTQKKQIIPTSAKPIKTNTEEPKSNKFIIKQSTGKPDLLVTIKSDNEYVIKANTKLPSKPINLYFTNTNSNRNSNTNSNSNSKLQITNQQFKTLKKIIVHENDMKNLIKPDKGVNDTTNKKVNKIAYIYNLFIDIIGKKSDTEKKPIKCGNDNSESRWNKCVRLEVKEYDAYSLLYFHIDGLMTGLGVRNEDHNCHKISATAHLRLVDYYFEKNTPKNTIIIGSLWDAAQNHIEGKCEYLDYYLRTGILSQSDYEFITENITGMVPLSMSTILETGLTFYEKYGYMRVSESSDTYPELSMNYFDSFNEFINTLITRQKNLNMTFGELVKYVKDISDQKTNNKYEAKFRDIMSVLSGIKEYLKMFNAQSELDIFNKITTIRQLLKWFISFKLDKLVRMCKTKLEKKQCILFYIAINNRIYHVSYKILTIKENMNSHLKFLRIPSTPTNNLVLQLHKSVPNVKHDFLPAEFHTFDNTNYKNYATLLKSTTPDKLIECQSRVLEYQTLFLSSNDKKIC